VTCGTNQSARETDRSFKIRQIISLSVTHIILTIFNELRTKTQPNQRNFKLANRMSGKIGCNRPDTFHGEESSKPSKYHHGPSSALKSFHQSRVSPNPCSPSTNPPSKVIHRRATTYGEGRPQGFLPLAPKMSPLRSGASGSGIKIKRVWTVDDDHTAGPASTLSLRDTE
jgi:hypothetical protein